MARAKGMVEAAEAFGSGPSTDAFDDAMQGSRGLQSSVVPIIASQHETRDAFFGDDIAQGMRFKVGAHPVSGAPAAGFVRDAEFEPEADSAVIGRVPDDDEDEDEIEVEVPDPECEIDAITNAEVDELADALAPNDVPFTRATVDGTEARIYRAPADLFESGAGESLADAIRALSDARESLELFTQRAKEAAAERKEAQELLNGCVERVIRARERERQPGLFA